MAKPLSTMRSKKLRRTPETDDNMQASTSQQPSIGPNHTKHGGEICPVYSRPDHGSSGRLIPLVVNWYRLNCGLEGKTIYIYDVQVFEMARTKTGKPKRLPINGRDKLRILFWNCLRNYSNIFGPYTRTVFDDFSKAFSMNRWHLKDDKGDVRFPYGPENGPTKEYIMSIKPQTDLIFDLSSKDDQQRNTSALVTKNLFTQRARYAPALSDTRGWSFVDQWEVCYGSIYRIPHLGSDPEISVKVGAGVRAWLGTYTSVKTLEDYTPALAFGLVNRLYYELEMDIITFYCDVLEELGLFHGKNKNRAEVLKGMGMNAYQRKRMTDRLSGVRLMTKKFLSWDKHHDFWLSERRMIFVEVADHPPRALRFGEMSMEEIYYRLGERLMYPNLPLCRVSIGKKMYELPMEVLILHEKPQRYTKTMNAFMKMKFIEGVCREPLAHKKLTERMFDWMEYGNMNMNFLRDFMASFFLVFANAPK
ncbi:unnamed protein product [Cylicocyclus nassatus]|uniref:Uncharacterized protein n=1 Tax=Cylicocyclus nassatus TaxID=53992 RepID=A0AA36DLJ7_CYLNA|nr:unnamed protein product [Cylicocyclus nassatus]